MAITQSIRRRGFRKWYERELLIGHSHLVLLLMCTLALLAGMEAFTQPGASRGLIALCLFVATGVGVWALRRYLQLLMRAEIIANQAVCPQCQAYGRWVLEATAPQPGPAEEVDSDAQGGEPACMNVCCRACGRRWLIEW
ncbi:MAG: hypothetical protein C0505_05375 [Leptothrix sp. (in: Bacteria)]|nr:hypothetical protein [Leptothrix sp. (in: b-proteobacteria)]